jgi:hypothetical protein
LLNKAYCAGGKRRLIYCKKFDKNYRRSLSKNAQSLISLKSGSVLKISRLKFLKGGLQSS